MMYTRGQFAVIGNVGRKALRLYEEAGILIPACVNEEEVVNSRLRELDNQTRSILETVQAMTQGRKAEDAESTRIDLVPFRRKECIFIQENVERENPGISVGKLYERAAREKLVPNGAHFVKYTGLMEGEGNFTMTTYLPVSGAAGALAGEEAQEYERCLHLPFDKGFSRVKEAHIELQRYAEEHGIRCTGTVLEVYNKDFTVDVYMVTE